MKFASNRSAYSLFRSYAKEHGYFRAVSFAMRYVITQISVTTLQIFPPNPLLLHRVNQLLCRSKKLHLGCGEKGHADGWINVDARYLQGVDLVCDLRRIQRYFPNASIEQVFMSHTLEHLNPEQAALILKNINRMLKPKGLLWLAVPDAGRLGQLLGDICAKRSYAMINGILMGGGRNRYDYHRSAFSLPYLVLLLEEAGFTNVRVWDSPPEAFREMQGGWAASVDVTLVSLNLVAENK
ncbi:MAG: class I SAM-dependent methyltransferase [Anaerolineae bacterium]